MVTVLIEYPVAKIFLCKKENVFRNTCLINALTNISLNSLMLFIGIIFSKTSSYTILYNTLFIIFEIVVVIVETFLWKMFYIELDIKKCVLLSIISNFISATIGKILF